MTEKWVFYKTTWCSKFGYRQYYVSNLGRVMMNGELYKCKIDRQGYKWVCKERLHVVVARLFIYNDDPLHKTHVDHINTIRTDNRVENLRYTTPKGNSNNPITKQKMKTAVRPHPWNYNKTNIYTEETKQKFRDKKLGTHRVYRTDGTWYMKKED